MKSILQKIEFKQVGENLQEMPVSNNSKIVTRLHADISNSRTSSFKEKISAISSNKQWEVRGRTTMTPVQEYNAWQAYGKELTRQNSLLKEEKGTSK